MSATNTPNQGPVSPQPRGQEQSQEICPRCGKPVIGYECGCPERWESEGGMSSPEDEG